MTLREPNNLMYTPQTFVAALLLVILSMFCWGSWPNFMKAAPPQWRLEYFYLDYAIGFMIAGTLCGATLGSAGSPGVAVFTRLAESGGMEAGAAMLGGFLWCLGNILMLLAIVIAGLAVAFPVSSVPAVVLGVGMSYWTQPIGNPLWLAGSVVFLLVAGFANAQAYRSLGNPTGSDKPKGVKLALMSGILVGIMPPCVSRALSGPLALDAYTLSIYFMLGALLAALVALPILLKHPIVGTIGTFKGYVQGKVAWHVLGLLAGFVWSFGVVANFLSAKMVGMAITWGAGNGAPMVGALWGIFLWREFAGGGSRAKVLIGLSMALYIAGVAGIALAYLNA